MEIDNKYLSSKLVSKEASVANSSCRVYYGEAAGAIPFLWESQPGTPKHTFSESSLPPLTPPPSYSTTPPNSKSMHKMSSKSKLFGTIFPRLRSLRKVLKAPNMSPSPPSSFSSSSSAASYSSSSWSSSSNYSSSSASAVRNKKGHKHRCFSVSRMPFDHNYGEDYDHDHHPTSGSPISSSCFGGKRKGTSVNGIRGCYSMLNIKFAFLSIVNHESGRRAA